jgi:hypothetical protein
MKQPGVVRITYRSSVWWHLLLGLALVGLLLSRGRTNAADTPPPQPPSPELQKTEVLSATYDVTWDKLMHTLESFDLGVAKSDKEKGTIVTVPRRYFKISSAKFPPVQEDYRDTYDVHVEKHADNKTTQVQITRKFEMYDRNEPPMGGWVVQKDVKEKTGTSVTEILSALALEIAAAALPAAH